MSLPESFLISPEHGRDAYLRLIKNKNISFLEKILQAIGVEDSLDNICSLQNALLQRVEILARENNISLPQELFDIPLFQLKKSLSLDCEAFAKDFFTPMPEIETSDMQSLD